MTGDRLRALWDFDDLDATQTQLRTQLEAEPTDAGRAEVLTQLARVEGLRDAFDAGDRLIDEAASLAGDDPVARARIDLERGRLRRSSGDPEAARPLFDAAFATALETDQTFIAVDAAHMAALVAPDRDGFVAWTERGIELADADEDARYWLGPLYNNLGWNHYDAGDFEGALTAFQRGLAAREEASEEGLSVEIARFTVGKALRALGRSAEAVPLLEQAVAWATNAGAPDGWFHEELAEEYAALGRDEDAAAQARAAIPLLERDDPDFAADEERVAHLRALSEDSS
jgi:tetratricopeptide (TPR) repeat protein